MMSKNLINRRWVLADYPEGMPDETHFQFEASVPLPVLEEDQILVQAHFLSVDPYMRGRISPEAGYTAGVKPGGLLPAGGVGEVIESRSKLFSEGEFVESMNFGWQEYSVLSAGSTQKVDPALAPIQSSLSYLGMPGMTAYFGLFDVGAAKPGETVLISAASGAVGQVAGQLAKAHGCRAVAVASNEAKLDWCREIGYDVGINYRETEDLPKTINDCCPNGVDVYFDNTAGPIHDAVMQNLNLNARVAVCGVVSLADKIGKPDIGQRYLRQILVNRARIQGFLVFDFAERYDEARDYISGFVRDGTFKFKEDISDGIESMAKSFIDLLHSENFGKKLIKI